MCWMVRLKLHERLSTGRTALCVHMAMQISKNAILQTYIQTYTHTDMHTYIFPHTTRGSDKFPFECSTGNNRRG